MPISNIVRGRIGTTSNRSGSRSGFSLIELSLVVAVMAITLVVVVSKIDSVIPATRTDSYARKLAAFIESGFSQAIASGKPVIITYDLNDNCYFFAFPNSGVDDDPYRFDHTEPYYFPSSIRMELIYVGNESHTTGVIGIKVNPAGRMKAHTIFIKDDADRKVTIEANPLTGSAAVYSGFVEPRNISKDDIFEK